MKRALALTIAAAVAALVRKTIAVEAELEA